MAWAVQVSFLELRAYFPGKKDLLWRCDNRYDKTGSFAKALAPECWFGSVPDHHPRTPCADAGIANPAFMPTIASGVGGSAVAGSAESTAGP